MNNAVLYCNRQPVNHIFLHFLLSKNLSKTFLPVLAVKTDNPDQYRSHTPLKSAAAAKKLMAVIKTTCGKLLKFFTDHVNFHPSQCHMYSAGVKHSLPTTFERSITMQISSALYFSLFMVLLCGTVLCFHIYQRFISDRRLCCQPLLLTVTGCKQMRIEPHIEEFFSWHNNIAVL